jgi:hypothetical protein
MIYSLMWKGREVIECTSQLGIEEMKLIYKNATVSLLSAALTILLSLLSI